eukprot:COSAG01_NODE_11419_length_1938_cov_14.231648_2_plen_71_part_01
MTIESSASLQCSSSQLPPPASSSLLDQQLLLQGYECYLQEARCQFAEAKARFHKMYEEEESARHSAIATQV